MNYYVFSPLLRHALSNHVSIRCIGGRSLFLETARPISALFSRVNDVFGHLQADVSRVTRKFQCHCFYRPIAFALFASFLSSGTKKFLKRVANSRVGVLCSAKIKLTINQHNKEEIVRLRFFESWLRRARWNNNFIYTFYIQGIASTASSVEISFIHYVPLYNLIVSSIRSQEFLLPYSPKYPRSKLPPKMCATMA